MSKNLYGISPPLRVAAIIAYFTLCFWSLYTAALQYTPIPGMFAYTKELALLSLCFFSLLLPIRRQIMNQMDSWFLFFIFCLILSIPQSLLTIGFDYNNTIYAEKYLQPFFALVVAMSFPIWTTIPLSRWIRWFVVMAHLLILLNIVGYFAPQSFFIHVNHIQYEGRISVGQPGVVAFPLLLALDYMLVIPKFNWKVMLSIFYLLFGILIMIPGTAIFIIIINIFLIILMRSHLKRDNALRLLLLLLAIGSVALAIGFLIALKGDVVKMALNLAEIKTKALLGLINDPSMNMRDIKFSVVQKEMGLKILFGTGLNTYTPYVLPLHWGVSLENMFRILLVNHGIFGLIAYVGWLFREVYVAWLHRTQGRRRVLQIIVLVDFFIYHYTLDVLYLFMFIIPVMFFHVYLGKKWAH